MNTPIHIPVYGSISCTTQEHRQFHRALLSAAAKAQEAQLAVMRARHKAKSVTGLRKARASAFFTIS